MRAALRALKPGIEIDVDRAASRSIDPDADETNAESGARSTFGPTILRLYPTGREMDLSLDRFSHAPNSKTPDVDVAP